MATFDDDLYREFMNAHAQSSFNGPFADFFNKGGEQSGVKFKIPKIARAAPPSPWMQATIGGFCSAASLAGFELELCMRSRTGGGRIVVGYSWRDRRGSMLAGEVLGVRGPELFAKVCQALADWDPSMMLWRSAFAEVLEAAQ
jgi:hypothetical protein